jgi:hypothetical protein
MAIITAQAKLYTGIRCLCVDKNISAALSASFSVGNLDIDFPEDGAVVDVNSNVTWTNPKTSVTYNKVTIYSNIYNWRLRRAVCDMRAVPSISLTDERYKTYGGGNVNITVSDNGRVVSVSEPDNTQIVYVGNFIGIVPESDNTDATPPTFDITIADVEDEGKITLTITNPGKNNAQGDTLTFDFEKFYPGSPAGEFTCTVDEITAPNTLLKTGGWTAVSTVSCTFPTYIEIDIEKLGIPEGTTCTLNFDEGWLLEDRGRRLPSGEWEYPDASQGALSPEQPNYVTFRTPWYGVGRFTSAFSLPNTVLRIKQLASSVSSTAVVVARGIFNPGRFAALQFSVSNVQAIVRKTAVSGANLFSSFGPFGPIAISLRIRPGDSALSSQFTMPSIDNWYTRLGVSLMTSTATISATVIRNIGVITATFQQAVQLNATGFRTAGITKEITAMASVSADIFVQKGLPVTNLGMTASLSVSGDVPMVLTTSSTGVRLPLWYGSINAVIDWGDGTTQTVTSTPNSKTNLSKDYSTPGTRTIYIKGFVQHWGYQNASQFLSQPSTLTAGLGYEIQSLGDIGIQTLIALKAGNIGIDGPTPWYIPSSVKDISYFFFRAGDISGGINNISRLGNWNTSNIERMEGVFRLAGNITAAPITGWNTGSVISMKRMFNNCRFNSNINGWDVSNVQDFSEMFRDAGQFNQSLSSWDVSSGTDFRFMFSQTNTATDFSGPTRGYSGALYNWNLSSATSPTALEQMLFTGYQYPGDITSWCVPNIASRPTNFAASGSGFYSGGEPVWGTCPGPRPIITVSTDKTTVNEGETITITITSSNVSTATLYFRINQDFPSWLNPSSGEGSPNSNTGRIYSQDVSPPGGTGGTVTLSSGTATLTLTIPQDTIIETTNESFRVDITSVSLPPSPLNIGQFLLGATPTLTISSNNT